MEQRRDFDLDARIAQWRRSQERASSLSPRELDELEDHLRAHVDLEMELNPGLGPARACRIACDEIGTGAALAKEFAKVGKARWRRMFLAGWAMYAASFLLPSARLGFDHGYQFVLRFTPTDLLYPQVLAFLLLPNLAMLMTIPALLGCRPPSGRWAKWLLGVAGVGAIGTAAVVSALIMMGFQNVGLWDTVAAFGTGYWTWTVSLTLVATALHLRAREWASAKLKASARVADRGVFR